jgi:streptogrisin C
MGRRRIAALTAAAAGLAGLALLTTQLPLGQHGSGAQVAPQLVAALQRDLHLSPAQAVARLASDQRAARAVGRLQGLLGGAYGGAWLSADGAELTVAVTDADQLPTVRSAGATALVVTRSQADLDALKGRLDRNAQRAPRTVSGWHVDASANSVVLVSTAADDDAAVQFAAASGVPVEAVRVIAKVEQPRPYADVQGGDAFLINGTMRCSIGFAVQGGFVTAGHCGEAGDTTTNRRGVALGVFQGSSFPGDDLAWVKVNSKWSPRPAVDDYAGGTVRVSGSREAPVGSAVCRSGSTSGWHCGTIQARNSSVRYPEGLVTGVTRTNVCAEPGDSGGAWVSGNQAQGVTSGGSGDCTDGGTTYFQPVNEILARYNLKLMTSSNTLSS